MKLTTRLALVVTILLSVSTLFGGAFSVYVSKNDQISNYKQSLTNAVTQLKKSKEDPIALALLIAEQSPIPMSLAYISNNLDVSYLVENAGSTFVLPEKRVYANGFKEPVQRGQLLERFFKINSKESLAFILSTSRIDEAGARTWKSILIFNIILILFGAIFITSYFRRDSKLNAAARQMQEFIGDASHELKTPLTVIRGYSEILSKSDTRESQFAKRINEESLRMSSIIDKLLAIAALDEGRVSESTDIDINSLLESKVRDLSHIQPERKIEYKGAPLKVKAPADVVDTLISNVISNARTHSPVTAPIRISVSGKKVIFEDGGSGLAKIPDKPFERFDPSRSRDTGGSGLGMSLIQKSAKVLDAKLVFGKSELGGLKVEVTF